MSEIISPIPGDNEEAPDEETDDEGTKPPPYPGPEGEPVT